MTMALSHQLFNLQSMLNLYFEADYTRVTWRDLRMWVEPLSGPLLVALREWEAQGLIEVVGELAKEKEDEVCLHIRRHISAVQEPEGEHEND
jgi:hypothetical protein